MGLAHSHEHFMYLCTAVWKLFWLAELYRIRRLFHRQRYTVRNRGGVVFIMHRYVVSCDTGIRVGPVWSVDAKSDVLGQQGGASARTAPQVRACSSMWMSSRLTWRGSEVTNTTYTFEFLDPGPLSPDVFEPPDGVICEAVDWLAPLAGDKRR